MNTSDNTVMTIDGQEYSCSLFDPGFGAMFVHAELKVWRKFLWWYRWSKVYSHVARTKRRFTGSWIGVFLKLDDNLNNVIPDLTEGEKAEICWDAIRNHLG